MIDCREAVRRMWAYLDHELEARPVSEFEAHLETCRRCCGELEFSRQVRSMIAHIDTTAPMPSDVRSRLEVLLQTGQPE